MSDTNLLEKYLSLLEDYQIVKKELEELKSPKNATLPKRPNSFLQGNVYDALNKSFQGMYTQELVDYLNTKNQQIKSGKRKQVKYPSVLNACKNLVEQGYIKRYQKKGQKQVLYHSLLIDIK